VTRFELSVAARRGLREVFARRPYVIAAFLVPAPARPILAIEYAERPPSVEEARGRIEELVAAVAAVLGDRVGDVAVSAGSTEDLASTSSRGIRIYERQDDR
jgi:hypothetical protein